MAGLYDGEPTCAEANSIIAYRDNSVVIAGNSNPCANVSSKHINFIKLNASGELDRSFGLNNSGMQKTVDVLNLQNPTLVKNGESGFYLGSTVNSSRGKQFHVMKYLISGQLDNSGVWPLATSVVSINNTDTLSSMIASDNKLNLIGSTVLNSRIQIALTRINMSNGSLDSSYGSDNGKTVLSGPNNLAVAAKHAAFLRDGSMFLASAGIPGFYVQQINNNATSLIQDFGNEGRLETTFPGSVSDSPSTVLPVGDTVYVVGNSVANNVYSISVARYLPYFASTTIMPRCGDGTCNGTESHAVCAADCPSEDTPTEPVTTVSACGNNICSDGETSTSCPADCADTSVTVTSVCGNGVCDSGESYATCAADCAAQEQRVIPHCGDHICNNGETAATCAADCSSSSSSDLSQANHDDVDNNGGSGGGCSLSLSSNVTPSYGLLMLFMMSLWVVSRRKAIRN